MRLSRAMLWALCWVLVAGSAPPEFRQVLQGGFVSAELGSNPAGVRLMGDVGVASYGFKTLDGRQWILQWNGDVGFRGGALVKSWPILPFLGGALTSSGEIGRRFSPETDWSGYFGIGAGFDLHVMASTDVPFSQLDVLGTMTDVGGLGTHGYLRVAGGASWIKGRHSFFLTLFGQTQFGVPSLAEPVDLFGGGGVEARWDYEGMVSVYIDAFVGGAFVTTHLSNGSTQQKTHEQLTAGFRCFLRNRMWVGGQLRLSGDQAVTHFDASGVTYRTSEVPSVALWAQYGIQIGE